MYPHGTQSVRLLVMEDAAGVPTESLQLTHRPVERVATFQLTDVACSVYESEGLGKLQRRKRFSHTIIKENRWVCNAANIQHVANQTSRDCQMQARTSVALVPSNRIACMVWP